MKVFYQVLTVLGSLGVFLYGMRLMSDGLQSAAGSRLKRVLAYMTTNRFAGVVSGFATTAIIQSSSATTVMVVGFVEAGLLSLKQAIGVIMGANIGTTVTGWIVALFGFKFSITSAALPAIAVGVAILLIKRIDRDDIGEMLLGFGLLFLGLGLLKDAVPDIRENPEILSFLARFTGRGVLSFVVFVAAGTIITVIVQSSSAAMAITLTMTFTGWIDYPTAAAIILGENIGTTVTAYLASLNSGVTARRAARAHTLFNLFGVFWIAFLFQPFLSLVDIIVPGEVTGRIAITAHLAMFHTLFNVVNTIICIAFVPQFERVVQAMVREKPSDRPGAYRFSYKRGGIQETVELSIVTAQAEIAKMNALVRELFRYFVELFVNPSKKVRSRRAEIEAKQRLAAEMHEQIAAFLVECSRESISEKMAMDINSLMRVVTELESIADTCEKLVVRARERHEKKLGIGGDLIADILPYAESVERFLAFNQQHLKNTMSDEEFREAASMEDEINAMQKSLKKAARKRIRKGASVKAELFYIDVLKHIEHIGDFSLAISQALTRIR